MKGKKGVNTRTWWMEWKQGFLATVLLSLALAPTTHETPVFDLCGNMSKCTRVNTFSYSSFQSLHRKLSQGLISGKVDHLVCVCVHTCMNTCMCKSVCVCTCVCCAHIHACMCIHMADDFSQFILRPHCFMPHLANRASLS